jgi:hypothetical protein
MATIPPPPPPPTPAEDDFEDAISSTTTNNQQPPSFIQLWIENERSERTTKMNYWQQVKNEYFEAQCTLFPRYIPESAICNVDSMIHLISEHCPPLSSSSSIAAGEDVNDDSGRWNNGDGGSDGSSAPLSSLTADTTTTLDNVRRIATQCSIYHAKAVKNYKQYEYKRALKNIHIDSNQQRIIKQSTDNTDNIPIPIPQRPNYHSEYTPMSYQENYAMTKIHERNYNICLAQHTCSYRTNALLKCWRSLDPQWVKYMDYHKLGHYICANERKGVERCVGGITQQAMKDILG